MGDVVTTFGKHDLLHCLSLFSVITKLPQGEYLQRKGVKKHVVLEVQERGRSTC
jgi:hypothetical protein